MTSTTTDAPSPLLAELFTPDAVRLRAQAFLDHVEAGDDADWMLDRAKLADAADRVAAVTRAAYPDLKVPLHARWRHFVFESRDLWAEIANARAWPDAAAKARAAFDLAVVSVLLDAGAGPDWRYRDAATGIEAARSEGLALASLRAFESGLFSAHPESPLRVDHDALLKMDEKKLADALQVGPDNPLVGLPGRVSVLQRLGVMLDASRPRFAGARPGGLYDTLLREAGDEPVSARTLFDALLTSLLSLWPDRPRLDGPTLRYIPLGDCWRHPAAPASLEGGWLPFHKLTQWLAYSLIEPIRESGRAVSDIDALTGLAEYRNGGLFVDAGVLVSRDPTALGRAHAVDTPFVIGWRACTVALLDAIAPLVRERLSVAEADFPLACVLEGGTWAAGRAIAKEKRADGGPPFAIISDGTVF